VLGKHFFFKCENSQKPYSWFSHLLDCRRALLTEHFFFQTSQVGYYCSSNWAQLTKGLKNGFKCKKYPNIQKKPPKKSFLKGLRLFHQNNNEKSLKVAFHFLSLFTTKTTKNIGKFKNLTSSTSKNTSAAPLFWLRVPRTTLQIEQPARSFSHHATSLEGEVAVETVCLT